VFVLKSGFFDTLTWGAIALQTLHHPLQTKPFPPSQSKVLRTKERDDIPPQISKHYLLGTGILRFSHCPSSENLMKKALHEITANSQGKLNPFSPIVGSLATVHPII